MQLSGGSGDIRANSLTVPLAQANLQVLSNNLSDKKKKMNEMELEIGQIKLKMGDVESSIMQLSELTLDFIMILNSKLTKLETFALNIFWTQQNYQD